MAIRASSIWASEYSIPLKIWPFQRELGNPAADVPLGDTAMERLKARRALARANYRQMEEKRAREYLGLPPAFVVEAETGTRLAAWLFNESAVRESMAGIWSEFEKLLAEDGRSPVLEVVLMSGPRSKERSISCLLIAESTRRLRFFWMIIGLLGLGICRSFGLVSWAKR